jgi:hypothetical protein
MKAEFVVSKAEIFKVGGGGNILNSRRQAGLPKNPDFSDTDSAFNKQTTFALKLKKAKACIIKTHRINLLLCQACLDSN